MTSKMYQVLIQQGSKSGSAQTGSGLDEDIGNFGMKA